MSELVNASSSRGRYRWQLLTTVSALALIGSVYMTSEVRAADAGGDHPTVWIELGGQFEGLSANEEKFAPAFLFAEPRPVPETISPLNVGHPPHFSVGGEGKIVFQPESSRWVFSASVRYGRSTASQHLRQQSPYPREPIDQELISRFPSAEPIYRQALQFMDTAHQEKESHAILDFKAGKDVGVGMFGTGAAVLALGVRFAQFNSSVNAEFKSDPDAHPTFIYYGSLKIPNGGVFHSNKATGNFARSFHGIGPSVSWNASMPVMGNAADGQFALDWGANAAVLFGRQKAFIHHQTTAHYHQGKYSRSNPLTTPYHKAPPDQRRSHSIVVPNIGGFAGISFRFVDAKLSFGYRADFFLGAMDGGLDTHKSENVGFHGPFATVSIGLGG
jgi:hypothetical protein